jgi:hypothetical protein
MHVAKGAKEGGIAKESKWGGWVGGTLFVLCTTLSNVRVSIVCVLCKLVNFSTSNERALNTRQSAPISGMNWVGTL